ncbi:RNA 3'-terminal phosphate cyclase domain-containing protein [Xylogone sp. PMI_703]|nr:RNA 3'-terminal phosphate cyclase domain-containing protein [Xylogone sp. PMI_703]
MAKPIQRNPVKLDGRTGEGGGQLVRVAVPLAVLTGTPIQITNVRGNRKDKRGGGLKAQHVTGISWLVDVSGSEVNGTCFVGSKTLDFTPSPVVPNFDLRNHLGDIKQDSAAASILLIFQSILPILLFYGQPINTVTIQGGTNVSYSLSYEYLEQVLLPGLRTFGIKVESSLISRGWSYGQLQHGAATFSVTRIPPGETIKAPKWPTEQGKVTKIDISIIVPRSLINPLKTALAFELDLVFPEVETEFKIVEDSMHVARVYAMLVARTSNGLRFGYDWLYDKTTKNKPADKLATELSQRLADGLDNELRKGGVVDEYLQDQLLIYQALAEGRTSITGTSDAFDPESSELDDTDEPFGDGSTHAQTVRWVASQLLPGLKWSADGRICEGIGFKVEEPLPN